MTRFAVDPAELSLTAEAIRRAAQEAEAVTSDHRSLSTFTAALLDPVVIAAMSDFINQWSYGLRTLTDDARRLADSLDLVIAYYVDTDIGVRTAIGGGTTAPSGVEP